MIRGIKAIELAEKTGMLFVFNEQKGWVRVSSVERTIKRARRMKEDCLGIYGHPERYRFW